MSYDRKIILDCDGVLFDWNAGFRDWMKRHDFHEQSDSYYSVSKRFGIEVASAKQLIRQFNESAAIGFLKPYKDVLPNIYGLAALGYKFEVVTALSTYEYSQNLRARNLAEVFPQIQFDRIFYTDTGADKKEILQREYGGSGFYWIEDKVENAIHGEEVGMRPIILRNPHHVSEVIPAHIPIFENWEEIYEDILREDLY